MGTESRSKSTGKHGIPGPGQYTVSSTFGRGPKYSIASKSGYLDLNTFIESPGPANYSPKYNYLFKNFSYSMSSRPNSSKNYVGPGPGNYNIRKEMIQVPSCK